MRSHHVYIVCFRNLVELRKTYGEAFFKKHNVKLGYMSAFVKAASVALMDQPVVNAGVRLFFEPSMLHQKFYVFDVF
jgi:pyruvate/2-oxoglutarate dehydrogenase complex dihydrolipoamide acyltransferase (E2) component